MVSVNGVSTSPGLGAPPAGGGSLATQGARSPASTSALKPTKAKFVNVDADDSDKDKEIEFQFNPTEYSLSKRVNYKKVNNVKSDAPRTESKGGDAGQLKLNLFFDTSHETGTNADVRKYVDKILALTKVKEFKGGAPRPPRCEFIWGKKIFVGLIQSVSYKFTLFQENGTPVRATVDVELTEYLAPKKGMNSPPMGIANVKLYLVKAGDTIDRIAAREYGDPTVWRYIAEKNRLDNPKDISPGQELVITPLNM